VVYLGWVLCTEQFYTPETIRVSQTEHKYTILVLHTDRSLH